MVSDSRLFRGTLTFGETTAVSEFSCQATNVVVEQQDGDTEDAVTVLCGDTVGGGSQPGPWHITGTVIQDFDAAATDNITRWSYENRNTEQSFTFRPNDTTNAPEISGTVQVKFLGIGGDVNARITRDFDWAIVGDPDFTWPGAGGTFMTETQPEPQTQPEPNTTQPDTTTQPGTTEPETEPSTPDTQTEPSGAYTAA